MNDLLKFITCGSVDDGKSTLIGHILYDAKLLFADQEKSLKLESRVGSRGGDIDYSLLLDGLMAEREQGITIDVAYRYFTTEKRSFIVADTPGHEEYTRNMAVGASFADLAIILVDAAQGVLIQTKRHARICKLMGIRYFAFAINKMDLVEYSEERFLEIQSQIQELVQELQLESVKCFPVSATQGDNVTTKSENMPWDTGDPIFTYLENVDIHDGAAEQGFYMPVQRVCRPDHTFRGFQGQIEAGTIHVGDLVTVLPSHEKAVIRGILVSDTEAEEAFQGQPVTLTLDKEVDVSRGCVITKDSGIDVVKAFEATLLWMDDQELMENKEYLVKLGTKRITGRVKKILYKIDINTGEQIQTDSISKNEIARCELILDEEIPVDPFARHKTMGELILIDRISNMTASCGVVEQLLQDTDEDVTVIEGDGLRAKVMLFDEFLYNDKRVGVDHLSSAGHVFHIGDVLPLTSEGYQYPVYLDILVLSQKLAVLVRNSRVFRVMPLSEYQYMGIPVVNGKGFAISIHSPEDFSSFINDTETLSRQRIYEKWMRFETYRRVIFNSNYWEV